MLTVIVPNQRETSQSQQQVAEQQRQTQPLAPTLDARGVTEGWSVRLASFSSYANALILIDRLQSSGHRAYIRELPYEQGTLTSVFVGP